MAMEWSDLRIFLAIARAGSLGRAARRLGLTQPTMGRRLRALESAVGHTLFQRTADGFVLTEEGAAVLSRAERIEEEAIAIERALAGQGEAIDGLLRVSSSDWFGIHVLTPLFAEFTRAHPGVTVELVTDVRLFSLARREADLVFRIRPFDEAEVVQRRLMRIDYAVYAAEGAEAALITLDAAFEDLPDVAWLKSRLPGHRVAYRSNNRDAQARACAAGAGLAVLPVAIGNAMPGIVRVDLGETPPSRDVWMGYHPDLRRLARLRALVDLVVDRLG